VCIFLEKRLLHMIPNHICFTTFIWYN